MFQTKSPNYVATILSQLWLKSSAQLPPEDEFLYIGICVITRPSGMATDTQREALLRPRAHGFCYVVFMRLVINGEERNMMASTLDALIEELGMKGDRVAVELNRDIVPRTNWSATALKDGDRLEIVHFVGGGSPGAGPQR